MIASRVVGLHPTPATTKLHTPPHFSHVAFLHLEKGRGEGCDIHRPVDSLLLVWLSYGISCCVLLGSIISPPEEKRFLLQFPVVYLHVYRSNVQTYQAGGAAWLSPQCPLAGLLSQEADLK